MSCDACIRAKVNPKTGRFNDGCFDCSARMLAHSPEFAESAKASALTPAYRGALQASFGERWREGHERVKGWAGRIG